MKINGSSSIEEKEDALRQIDRRFAKVETTLRHLERLEAIQISDSDSIRLIVSLSHAKVRKCVETIISQFLGYHPLQHRAITSAMQHQVIRSAIDDCRAVVWELRSQVTAKISHKDTIYKSKIETIISELDIRISLSAKEPELADKVPECEVDLEMSNLDLGFENPLYSAIQKLSFQINNYVIRHSTDSHGKYIVIDLPLESPGYISAHCLRVYETIHNVLYPDSRCQYYATVPDRAKPHETVTILKYYLDDLEPAGYSSFNPSRYKPVFEAAIRPFSEVLNKSIALSKSRLLKYDAYILMTFAIHCPPSSFSMMDVLKGLNIYLIAYQEYAKQQWGTANVFDAEHPGFNELTASLRSLFNIKDILGSSVLHGIVRHNYCLQFMPFLIKSGLDVNAKDMQGLAPLHMSASRKQYTIVQTLLSLKADPNITDNKGNRPIHWAIDSGCMISLENLLKAGALPNCQNQKGQSGLHIAARKSSSDAVKLLLRYGADLYLSDNDELTAAEIAFDRGYSDIVALFEAHHRMLIQQKVESWKLRNESKIDNQEDDILPCLENLKIENEEDDILACLDNLTLDWASSKVYTPGAVTALSANQPMEDTQRNVALTNSNNENSGLLRFT